MVISLRSDVNGTSATRSNLAVRTAVSPSFRSATRKAASVGSPSTSQASPSERSVASLASDASFEHELDFASQLLVMHRFAVHPDLADRFVPDPGDVDFDRRRHDLHDRHLVAGQGAGLVGADHRRRPEGLHRREPLHDRPLRGHALDAERQDHREDRRQTLWHRRDGERHADQQRIDHVGGAADGRRNQDRNDDDGRQRHHGDTRAPRPSHEICCWSGVRSSEAESSSVAIRPISVSIEVATTTPRPRPRTTAVPL